MPLKQPSQVKLMLANSCRQTQNWCVWTTKQHVGKLLATNRPCLYSRQQFANMLLCRSHTPIWVCQHQLANISLTFEGRLRLNVLSMKNLHVPCAWLRDYKIALQPEKCKALIPSMNYKAAFTCQTYVGQLVLAKLKLVCVWMKQQHVGKLSWREIVLILASSFPTCCCVVHTHQV